MVKVLNQIHQSLQEIHGFENPLGLSEYLHTSKERSALLVKESSDGADVAVCLQEDIVKRLGELSLPEDFSLERFPDLSVVVEELSHFNHYCNRALADREVSSLELEVYGEIDKFALALKWIQERNENFLKEKVFETLFGQIHLGEWVSEEERTRYQDAHSIARQFCREMMKQSLSHDRMTEAYRSFMSLPTSERLSVRLKN